MYDKKVNFTSTERYGNIPEGEDDVYTIDEFVEACECNAFIDYDGFGYPVKDNMADETLVIKPSRLNDIPEDATHIVWYNR